MQQLICPKCRHTQSDDALDSGECPYCGFDGPAIAAPKWLRPVYLALSILALGVVATVLIFRRQTEPNETHPSERDTATVIAHRVSDRLLANPQGTPTGRSPAPAPRQVSASHPTTSLEQVIPERITVEPPKGPVIRIVAAESPERHLDYPYGAVSVADLTRADRLKLTGRVRLLRLGSISGNSILDASELVANEVIISGDVSHQAVVRLNAPKGVVRIGGHVVGSASLVILAPDGELLVTASSAKLGGDCRIATTTRRVAIQAPVMGNASLSVTFTSRGVLQVAEMSGQAKVQYELANPNDSEPLVEIGILRDQAKVHKRN